MDANDTVNPAAVGHKTTLVVCDAKGTFTKMVAAVKAS